MTMTATHDSCSNPGHDNRFTCPACYFDFDGRKTICPGCGADIICAVEQQPVAVCTLGVSETEDE